VNDGLKAIANEPIANEQRKDDLSNLKQRKIRR
jgi:hypothetical protein